MRSHGAANLTYAAPVERDKEARMFRPGPYRSTGNDGSIAYAMQLAWYTRGTRSMKHLSRSRMKIKHIAVSALTVLVLGLASIGEGAPTLAASKPTNSGAIIFRDILPPMAGGSPGGVLPPMAGGSPGGVL